MVTRLPVEEAERLRDLAEKLDMTYSDTLAALARVGYSHLDELPVTTAGTQQELPPMAC